MSEAPDVIGGAVKVTIGGVNANVKGEVTGNLGGFKYEAIEGKTARAGVKKIWVSPSVKLELADNGGIDTSIYRNVKGVTVIVEMASGKVYAWYECYRMNDGEIGSEEGSLEVEYTAARATEITV